MEYNRRHILQSIFDENIGNRKTSYTADTFCHTWLHTYKKNKNKIVWSISVKQILTITRTCGRKPRGFGRAHCRLNETDWLYIRSSLTYNDDHKPVLLDKGNGTVPPISLLQSFLNLKLISVLLMRVKWTKRKNTSVTKVAIPLQRMATRELDQFNLMFAGVGRARFLAKERTLMVTIQHFLANESTIQIW